MKNFYSCLIILTFFNSCAPDERNAPEIHSALSSKEAGEATAANSANAYDSAGKIFDELFDSYYDGSSRPNDVLSIIQQVESIANTNESFNSIGSGHVTLSPARISHLAAQKNVDIPSVVLSSGLSATAKTSFGNFLLSIATLYDVENDAIKMRNAIVKYEATVLHNESLTDNDRRVILTSTSILRYSAYRAKKKPKKNTDPYWNIWVTHVFGSEEGAEENLEKAILQGLVTGIVSHK